ncbi:hypothetical protein GCM10010447_52820 [Streptomyces fulvorobeus]
MQMHRTHLLLAYDMTAPRFPHALHAAQVRLHRATAELLGFGRSLPWPVEPHEGWPGKEHSRTGEVTGGRPPSPGWTDEQKATFVRAFLRADSSGVRVSGNGTALWTPSTGGLES